MYFCEINCIQGDENKAYLKYTLCHPLIFICFGHVRFRSEEEGLDLSILCCEGRNLR